MSSLAERWRQFRAARQTPAPQSTEDLPVNLEALRAEEVEPRPGFYSRVVDRIHTSKDSLGWQAIVMPQVVKHAGSLLIVKVYRRESGPPPSVTDSLGNSFHTVGRERIEHREDGSWIVWLFQAKAVTQGDDCLTIHSRVPGGMAVEFSQIDEADVMSGLDAPPMEKICRQEEM